MAAEFVCHVGGEKDVGTIRWVVSDAVTPLYGDGVAQGHGIFSRRDDCAGAITDEQANEAYQEILREVFGECHVL